MTKTKALYSCSNCGAQFPKWIGQCPDCNAWNSLVEERVSTSKQPLNIGYAGLSSNTSQVTKITAIEIATTPRITTGSTELDRVLGGGIVGGSVILLGGDPGIGKSTLLLQALCHLSLNYKVLYITGEESLQQVSMRAQRLSLSAENLLLLTETNIERILTAAQTHQPDIIVIDSIQTMFTDLMQSAPGSVGQVRESAAALVRFAKQSGIAFFLVGHVTKEGALAGPRVLEHMVDCVLYFEGQADNRYRVIRAIKNRFGAVNEIGVFAMGEKGLKDVSNPSAIFLSRPEEQIAGSIIMATWEGTRPLLVEVQALVDSSHLGNPRRISVGFEHNRLAMLLAVLNRHGHIATHDQDVFANIVGGVRVTETGIDLAILLAITSSLRNIPAPADMIVFGEVGLAGEIRPVQSGQERLMEAAKQGFKQAIIPQSNLSKRAIPNMKVHAVRYLHEALEVLRG